MQAQHRNRPLEIHDKPPEVEMTLRGVGIAASFWFVYMIANLLSILHNYNTMAPESLRFTVEFALSIALPGALIPALASIPVWQLIIRNMDTAPWNRKLLAHLVVGPLYAYLVVIAERISFHIFSAGRYGREIDIFQDLPLVWFPTSQVILYVLQFSIYHGVRAWQRLQFERRRSGDLQNLARERELAALRSRVNPHFLFNTLNSISAMVSRDTATTRHMLSQLADLMRYSLAMAERDLVPLEQELSIIRAFLDLEQQRLGSRLRVRYEIDPGSRALSIPPLLLLPLVENAIKHGIAPFEPGGEICVSVVVREDSLHCSVTDSGTGPPPDLDMDRLSEQCTGLRNTSMRLQRRFGSDAGLSFARRMPHGMQVHVVLPLIPKQDDSLVPAV